MEALGCHLLEIVVQVPFIASDVYTGPIARAMGGIDLSWVVGLLVVSLAYPLAVRMSRAPAHARLPGDSGRGVRRVLAPR